MVGCVHCGESLLLAWFWQASWERVLPSPPRPVKPHWSLSHRSVWWRDRVRKARRRTLRKRARQASAAGFPSARTMPRVIAGLVIVVNGVCAGRSVMSAAAPGAWAMRSGASSGGRVATVTGARARRRVSSPSPPTPTLGGGPFSSCAFVSCACRRGLRRSARVRLAQSRTY